jgi:predicted nucleic acid-binding protein
VIILDTNVLSALMRRTPDKKIIEWLDRQPRTSVWTTSVTILEIRFGLHVLPAGKRRSLLIQAFEAVLREMGERVAPFDIDAAQQAGDLMASRQKKGRPIDLRDAMIAGIVLARHSTLATRNTLHFEGISASVVNPWIG